MIAIHTVVNVAHFIIVIGLITFSDKQFILNTLSAYFYNLSSIRLQLNLVIL